MAEVVSAAVCGKGWASRCAHSTAKRCRCRCGGANHGSALLRSSIGHEATAPTVSFEASKAELALVDQIVDRALQREPSFDRVALEMDLVATHANGEPMNFEKLLAADDFDFWHDVYGIRRHLDRRTGKLTRCFLPRAARARGGPA